MNEHVKTLEARRHFHKEHGAGNPMDDEFHRLSIIEIERLSKDLKMAVWGEGEYCEALEADNK